MQEEPNSDPKTHLVPGRLSPVRSDRFFQRVDDGAGLPDRLQLSKWPRPASPRTDAYRCGTLPRGRLRRAAM